MSQIQNPLFETGWKFMDPSGCNILMVVSIAVEKATETIPNFHPVIGWQPRFEFGPYMKLCVCSDE